MPKPSNLLLEYRQDGRKTWAIRFYQNGLVKEYSNSEMVFENDQVVTRSRPLAWREIAHLSQAELEKLITRIRQVNFFTLPEKLGDPKRVMDGQQSTWIVNLDGQQKTVLAVEPEATSNPAIKELREMIQDVTADAFDREGNEDKS
jgi:hypothetical protein